MRRAPGKHIPYFNLIEAMGSPGCPICRQAEEAVEAAIRHLLHELVNDSTMRARIASSFGFCHEHGWRLVAQTDVLGTAILHRELVNRFRDLVLEGPRGWQRSREAPARPCSLCEARDETADRSMGVLLEQFGDERVQEAFGRTDGLCRRHFAAAVARARDQGLRGDLVRAQEACLDRLLGNLDELIRKHDYRFREEGLRDAERDAWTRAVAAVSGLDIHRVPRARSATLPPVRRQAP